MKKFLSALALVLAIAAPLSAQQKFKLFTQVVAKPSGTTGDLIYVSDTSGTITRLPAAPTQGQCLLSTGTPILPGWGACVAGGTVTSVGLALPGTLFSVTGSPVTASGTLSGALLAQSANAIFAGPTSGGSTAPTFRLFVTADYPDESVTFAKVQNIATDKLLGRATAGAGDIEEITLGTGLSFTGTTLNASGGAGGGHTIQEAGGAFTARAELNFLAGFDLTDNAGADSSDVAFDLSEVAGGGDLSWSTNTPTIPSDTVTFAKMQNIATAKLLGRATAATGNVEEITLGTNLSYTGTTLNAAGGGSADAILGASGAGGGRISGLQALVNPGGGSDDEFDTTDSSDPLTGWTSIGPPTAHDTNTTRKSHYRITQASGGSMVGIYKAWSPGAGAMVETVINATGPILTNYVRPAQLFVGEATPGKMMAFGFSWNGGLKLNVDYRTSPATLSGTAVEVAGPNRQFDTIEQPVYLRIVYNSSTSVNYQVSLTGITWTTILAAHDPTFTIGSVGLVANGDGAATEAFFDWIRFTP